MRRFWKNAFVIEQHGSLEIILFSPGQTMTLLMMKFHVLMHRRRANFLVGREAYREKSKAEDKKETEGDQCFVEQRHNLTSQFRV